MIRETAKASAQWVAGWPKRQLIAAVLTSTVFVAVFNYVYYSALGFGYLFQIEEPGLWLHLLVRIALFLAFGFTFLVGYFEFNRRIVDRKRDQQ